MGSLHCVLAPIKSETLKNIFAIIYFLNFVIEVYLDFHKMNVDNFSRSDANDLNNLPLRSTASDNIDVSMS
uniref:Uncharacterized protein n=1 Tax=Onchocerca volvulus TaxID=6282 RepID=A0A8R1TYW4_ONCVO